MPENFVIVCRYQGNVFLNADSRGYGDRSKDTVEWMATAGI